MVGLIGSLGIDWKILIIQSLNFIFLFLLLRKIFFVPFIREVKKEKKERSGFEKEKISLEAEKQNWQKQKNKEIAEVKKKISEILKEAEKISAEIREKAVEDIDKEKEEMMKRLEERKKGILLSYRDNFIAKYQKETKKKIIEVINSKIDKAAREKIQESFWQDFISFIRNYDFPKEKILVDERKKAKEKKKKKIELRVIFSSASPISKDKEREIISLLENIFGEKVKILLEKKINKNLIAGFSLNLLGVLIENSLAAEIEKQYD